MGRGFPRCPWPEAGGAGGGGFGGGVGEEFGDGAGAKANNILRSSKYRSRSCSNLLSMSST